MNNMEQLQAALTAADAAYVEKTGKQPYIEAGLDLKQTGSWRAVIWICGSFEPGGTQKAIGEDETPDAAIAGLMEVIASLPTEAEMNLRAFQRDLGHLIDKGRELGVPVDYVNPLVETAKRLAENALTDQRERVSA